MKNLVKSALLGIAIMFSVNFASAQEISYSAMDIPCTHDLHVTFPTTIGSVVPANTIVDFTIYFKPEWVENYGADYRIVRHQGYIMDQPTPFLLPDFCHGYPINRIRAVQFKVYFGDGRTCSYPYGGYIDSWVVSLPGTGTPGGSTN